MKNLLKYLSPFAPDQSGASAVLYELGGVIVICDAGGCTGNICGFDEPRWLNRRSAVFSAGLRDMDAIMGRDDRLIEKLCDAADGSDAKFTAIIGTPVPAVIATDFKALKRMAEKKTGLPSITVYATGADYYDEGEENAFLQLFEVFAAEKYPVENGRVGVLGATPLEISSADSAALKAALPYENPLCYGMGSGLEDIKRASAAEKNIVIAPSALKTAEYLRDKFGTPYEIAYPLIPERVRKARGEKILVVHQQVAANSVRNALGGQNVTVASFFMLKPELAASGDFHIDDEADLVEKVYAGGYDVIIGDANLKRALGKYSGEFIDMPHFAVSGRLG